MFGCGGFELSADEKAFYKDASPAGFILFQKNCDNPEQVKKLCADLRACVDWDAPILIDQEGGRVQRLKPPVWPKFPNMRTFGDQYKDNKSAALQAVSDNHKALAEVQCPLGIDVNCVPVMDVVPTTNTVKAIDDRSFGAEPEMVSDLGIAAIKASIENGMTPVMKHIPGHGRATVDSHHALPRLYVSRADLEKDWQPFKDAAAAVDNNRLWGMTAHVIYEVLDDELPATLSPSVISEIIRKVIGFNGLLLTDDLFMDALAPYGDTAERARKAVEAGADIALFCHGTIAEREAAAKAVGPMFADTRKRLEAWMAQKGV